MSGALKGCTIVFDLDGTLVDSAPDLLAALNHVLDIEGLPYPSEAVVRSFVGHGARALIERATGLAGAHFTSERLEQLTAAFIDYYSADVARLSRPFPGVVEALDELAAEGAILSVCTNKRTALSIQLLEALDLAPRFAAIVGADSVAARKPDPQHYREAVSRAGGDLARSLLVGDTEVDAQAARGAGAPVVLVRFGYGRDIDKLDCDGVLEGYEELAALARRLLI